MSGLFSKKGKNNSTKKKKRLSKDGSFKHEVNYVYNTFYKDQVAALYREITRGRIK